jgi:type I restriction enzyme S subunit|tara:strand:- start:1857 stop:3032 length:1176 start_codon:yes stop_codon:yes gene_type:complete
MSEVKTDLKIDLNNLNKSNWETYRFDEIAKNISERVDPNNTDLKVYIGLEHIDSESLHIKRHGTPDDVNGTKLKFYKGDIIFGRRRAYQRKAGIATWDGFCSAHALVLRANHDVIDPELFPFFLHSDLFMNRAIDISVGSLSPTINWGTLKHQEFLIPPREIQTQLSHLFKAIEQVNSSVNDVTEKLSELYQSKVDELFSNSNKGWEYIELKKLAGINKASLKGKTNPDYKFKYLDIASIIEPNIIGELDELKFSEAPSRARRIVSDDSIVLSLVRPYQRSFVYVTLGKDIIASTGTGVVDVKEPYVSRFVYHQFFSNRFLKFCENRMTGTNYPAITPKDLEAFKVGIPDDEKSMATLANQLDDINVAFENSRTKAQSAKQTKVSLINRIF